MTDAELPDAWVVLPPTEILATVDVAAVPEIPYASLRGLLIPVRDADGALADWELSAGVLGEPELLAEYRAWRARWKMNWPMGPVSNIDALRRTIVEMGHAVAEPLDGLLAALSEVEATGADGLPYEVHPDSTGALLEGLEALRLALLDTIEAGPGAGIVDDMPGSGRQVGLARTWVPDDVEHVLAATAATAVVVRPGDGLVVLHHGPAFESFPWVTEVNLLHDPAIVFDDQGERLELSGEQARPLGWLVPRSLRWHVRTVPLVAVWAQLFVGLPEALAAAAAGDGTVRFTTRLPLR